jgi:hypothetical protein
MSGVLHHLERYLVRRGERCHVSKDGDLLRCRFEGSDGWWQCTATVREDRQALVFYSTYPFAILPGRMRHLERFITRLNSLLTYGNVELDDAGRHVRCRTSVDLHAAQRDRQLLRETALANIILADSLWPIFRDVASGNLAPEKALKRVPMFYPDR